MDGHQPQNLPRPLVMASAVVRFSCGSSFAAAALLRHCDALRADKSDEAGVDATATTTAVAVTPAAANPHADTCTAIGQLLDIQEPTAN